MYLITGLISVVNLFLRNHFGSKKICKFAEVDAIPQSLLQLGGRGQIFI